MTDAAGIGIVLGEPGGAEPAVAAFRELLPAVAATDGTGDDGAVVLLPPPGSPWPAGVDDAALAVVARSLCGLVTRVVVFDHGLDIADKRELSGVRAFLSWSRSRSDLLVVRSSDLWSRYIVDCLRHVVDGDSGVFDGRVAVLHRLDATSRSEHVATLTSFLDHGGDVGAAAEAMFLHPNTLRYRLRRMKEIAGLDLADPLDRFVAEMQIRLRFSRPS